jgi:hypothetical protein
MSMMFILIATLCYLSDNKVISYVIAAAALSTYESAFMLFFAVPLLKQTWDRRLAKETVVHALALVLIIIFMVAVRVKLSGIIGNFVSAGDNLSHFIPKAILSTFVLGPLVSLYSFFYGLMNPLFHWEASFFVFASVCFALMFSMLYFPRAKEAEGNTDAGLTPSQVAIHQESVDQHGFFIEMKHLILTALIMLCLGYSLSFTHYPPFALKGRMTSVHLAAAFGGSLLFACLASLFISVLNRYRLKTVAIGIIACYLSILCTYHLTIQNDFKKAWKDQRRFWTELLKECPDMHDGTILVYLREYATTGIMSNSWADDFILERIVTFPKNWATAPRVYAVYQNNWDKAWYVGKEGIYKYPWEVISSKNDVILLKTVNNKLIRINNTIILNGIKLNTIKRTSAGASWEKGPLFDILIMKEM